MLVKEIFKTWLKTTPCSKHHVYGLKLGLQRILSSEINCCTQTEPVLLFSHIIHFHIAGCNRPIYRTGATEERRRHSTQHFEYKNIIMTLNRCGIQIGMVLTLISFIQSVLCISPSSHSSSIDLYSLIVTFYVNILTMWFQLRIIIGMVFLKAKCCLK